MSDDRIKAKIRALLAKAQSTEHKEEADACMGKAAELMAHHQIELYELGTEDPIGLTKGVEGQPGPPSYKTDVQVQLAKLYGATAVINQPTGRKWVVDLIGPESSRVTTELMTDYVWSQVNKAAKEIAATGTYKKDAAVRHVAKALCVRIHNEILSRKPPAEQPHGTAFSIVTVNAIESWMKNNYGELEYSKPRPKSISRMASEKAQGISLNHQVGRGTRLQLGTGSPS